MPESVVAALSVAGSDFAELSLIFLYIVSEREEKLLGILGAHDHAADNGSLRHAGSSEDEVDEELAGAVADHCEVSVLAICQFRAKLNLKLILVFFIFHFLLIFEVVKVVQQISGQIINPGKASGGHQSIVTQN